MFSPSVIIDQGEHLESTSQLPILIALDKGKECNLGRGSLVSPFMTKGAQDMSIIDPIVSTKLTLDKTSCADTRHSNKFLS